MNDIADAASCSTVPTARHDAVQLVCVFGVLDKLWRETIETVVIPDLGMEGTTADLITWCREQHARYKRPRYIQFLTAEMHAHINPDRIQRQELAKTSVSERERIQ